MERRSGVPACRRRPRSLAHRFRETVSCNMATASTTIAARPRSCAPSRASGRTELYQCSYGRRSTARRRGQDGAVGLGSGAALALLPAFWDLAGVGGRTRVARRLASRLGYPLRLTPPSVALAARARGTRTRPRARLRKEIKHQRVQRPESRVHRFRDLALGHEHYVCRRARGRCFRFLVHL
jgi:hypothetical protein